MLVVINMDAYIMQCVGTEFNGIPLCTTSSVPCWCVKRNDSVRCKALNYRVLAVIPGPSIPKNLRPYLSDTVRAFRRFGVDCEGFEVSYATPMHTLQFRSTPRCFKHQPGMGNCHVHEGRFYLTYRLVRVLLLR